MRSVRWLLLICTINGFACSQPGALPLLPPKHGIYVIAHRGAHNGIPENTLEAYQKAIDLGADFVEIDLRSTKDGEFVSIHNSTVDAYVEGITGEVKDFTLAELRNLDIGIRIGPEWQGTRIPTFEEILDLCKDRIGIYLDLKQAPVAPLIALVKARNMENQVLWLADTEELQLVEELCDECIIMPDPGPEKNLSSVIEKFHPLVIAPVWRHYSRSFAQTCHEAGALVFVDEDDPGSWPDALAWQSDGIQTDHPEELIEYLREHIAE